MMDSRQSFSFSTEPWLAGLSVLVCAITIALSYFAWQRSGYSRSVLWLEALRCGIVGSGALLLNQPEWVQELRSEEKPAFVILADASESMQTEDILVKGDAGQNMVKSRAVAIAPLLDTNSWDSLKSRMDVQIQSFPSNTKQDGTDINSALNGVLDSSQRLLGVVLLSDGDWNSGTSPMNAAMRYRAQGIPILSIPVGAPTRLPDIELLSVDTPTFGIVNKAVRIPFTIESALPRDHVVNVVVNGSDGERITKEVRIAAMSRTSEFVMWTPKTEGDFTLSVEVPAHPDEVISTNNSVSTPIAIRAERLKVLVIDSFPRWEYRYLRNALSRDPGVDVAC
ncbi:MAG: vWA domain-containing protein, partial [Pirellula sp.]